ncbi:hypothetical protein GRI97_05140 [Altererythrobacter xixiisoli]|uniref:Uncharacterized protein n=1 Tax=Croceibacterium xixiisoli TaxID=1476466 RepID=A0A6I4TSR5_9SPHN|nr:hypothetical protein [Croceibacterium xixiisoli]MXO98369.1 hypothetical protein [Croceibacterium xixiisoli]
MTEQKSGSKKLLLLGGAVVVAAVGVLGFVLPAEYGKDPLGIGKATGVLKLSEEVESEEVIRGKARGQVIWPIAAGIAPEGLAAELTRVAAEAGVAAPAADTIKTDRYTIELLPFEAIEMKYDLAEKAPLIFSWKAPVPVHYDMHSHPHVGGEEMTEGYSVGDAAQQSGVYVAQFAGIHGWYWQNRTIDPVTVTVDVAGPINASFTFDKTGKHPRDLNPIGAETAAPAAGGAPSPTPEAAAPAQ